MDAQFSLDTKIKVGIIGFGRMGRFYWEAMRKSGRWEIAYICDTDPTTRELAKKISPESRVVENDQKIFEDESVPVSYTHLDVYKRQALKTIWIDDNYFNARSMDVYITKLRKHLKEDDSIEIINIHGKGYKLITPEVES